MSAAGFHLGQTHAPKYIFPDTEKRKGLPPTHEMLHAAVSGHNTPVIRAILEAFPSLCLRSDSLMYDVLADPDLTTFELLYNHDLTIGNFNFQTHQGLWNEACRGGNPSIPIYMLDLGANPNEGGFPGRGHSGPHWSTTSRWKSLDS